MKLIIPNATDLYQGYNKILTYQEAVFRQSYHQRFLWLLEPGDIMLLASLPSTDFYHYLLDVKNLNENSVKLVTWAENNILTSVDDAFNDPQLIKQLRENIQDPSSCSIHTCYFNRQILTLAKQLSIPVHKQWAELVEQDFITKLNSKRYFRELAISHHIPITKGNICHSSYDLAETMKELFCHNPHLIIKQLYNAGGRGNIGISLNELVKFSGVQEIITLNLEQVAHYAEVIWNKLSTALNTQLIIEIYYPSVRTLTTMIYIPKDVLPILLHDSEIRMETTWIGVEIPTANLSSSVRQQLQSDSLKFAEYLQKEGYQGYLCCDAILTQENELLFTEINVRPGAETHAHILSKHFFNEDYRKKIKIITRRGVKIRNFKHFYQQLNNENLLFTADNREGVIILGVDEKYTYETEYLIASPTTQRAYALENKILKLRM